MFNVKTAPQETLHKVRHLTEPRRKARFKDWKVHASSNHRDTVSALDAKCTTSLDKSRRHEFKMQGFGELERGRGKADVGYFFIHDHPWVVAALADPPNPRSDIPLHANSTERISTYLPSVGCAQWNRPSCRPIVRAIVYT
jgi:hypothetical protein